MRTASGLGSASRNRNGATRFGKDSTVRKGNELDGKFFTQTEANELAAKEPELIEKFRKARKRDGKIEIVSPN